MYSIVNNYYAFFIHLTIVGQLVLLSYLVCCKWIFITCGNVDVSCIMIAFYLYTHLQVMLLDSWSVLNFLGTDMVFGCTILLPYKQAAKVPFLPIFLSCCSLLGSSNSNWSKSTSLQISIFLMLMILIPLFHKLYEEYLLLYIYLLFKSVYCDFFYILHEVLHMFLMRCLWMQFHVL